MAINPNKLSFMRQTDFIPVNRFSGMGAAPTITVVGGDASITAIGLADDANDAAISKGSANDKTGITGVQPPRSAGVGNPVMIEIGTTGLCGLLMAAADDDVRHLMPIPTKWSRNQPIRFRVVWSSEAAAVGNRTITWKVLYSLLTSGTSVIAAPATALDTEIVVQAPSGTAKTAECTTSGILNNGLISDTHTDISFLVEMEAFHADLSENKYLLGVEIEYTPRYGRGLVRKEARPWQAY